MKLRDLNQQINSELTTKVKDSIIENDELVIEVDLINLYSTILFLKTNGQCKFKQLIDIVAADYPNNEKS